MKGPLLLSTSTSTLSLPEYANCSFYCFFSPSHHTIVYSSLLSTLPAWLWLQWEHESWQASVHRPFLLLWVSFLVSIRPEPDPQSRRLGLPNWIGWNKKSYTTTSPS